MKKIILVGLMAVSFNVSAATVDDLSPEISKLCGNLANLAGTVSDKRREGASWKFIYDRLDFLKVENNMSRVAEELMRTAYYQGLDRDITETLAYSNCKMKMRKAVQ